MWPMGLLLNKSGQPVSWFLCLWFPASDFTKESYIILRCNMISAQLNFRFGVKINRFLNLYTYYSPSEDVHLEFHIDWIIFLYFTGFFLFLDLSHFYMNRNIV